MSPNVRDGNLESANLVDTTDGIARGLHRIASALNRTPGSLFTCEDGGVVGDAVEGLIYIGQGLHRIAEAINNLSCSVDMLGCKEPSP